MQKTIGKISIPISFSWQFDGTKNVMDLKKKIIYYYQKRENNIKPVFSNSVFQKSHKKFFWTSNIISFYIFPFSNTKLLTKLNQFDVFETLWFFFSIVAFIALCRISSLYHFVCAWSKFRYYPVLSSWWSYLRTKKKQTCLPRQ